MVEFTSEPQRKFSYTTLLTALGLLGVILGGILLYVHYQRKAPLQPGATAVVVPDLLRSGNTNFDYYKTKVRLENVRATLGISLSQARTAIISGIIFNDGDRKLEAVELHITLYDVWGKISRERTAFALRPGAGYSGRSMEPLEKRPFTIGVESVEYYWDPKQIAYEITGLKYQ
jgi:hypothetical protein